MTMTVKDLQDILADFDPSLPVILSKDGEGNEFREMHQAAHAMHVPGRWGRAEIYNPDEAPDGSKPCVVLWPS